MAHEEKNKDLCGSKISINLLKILFNKNLLSIYYITRVVVIYSMKKTEHMRKNIMGKA